jgi:mono/diheme cytochrome c family protein
MPNSNDALRRWVAARFLGLTILLFAFEGMSGSVADEADGDAAYRAQLARGREIAETHCAVCHAIGEADASPTAVNVETAFRLLYKRYPIEMLPPRAYRRRRCRGRGR